MTCLASTSSRWQLLPNQGKVDTAELGRFCCKSLRARWGKLFQGRAGAARKKTWGSTQTTTHATKDFPNRVAMPLNEAFSSRRLSRRFFPHSIFRLLQQNRPNAGFRRLTRFSALRRARVAEHWPGRSQRSRSQVRVPTTFLPG